MAGSATNREQLQAQFREAFGRRDYRKAMDACRALIEANPRDAVAWRDMGAVYTVLGQHESAYEVLTRALQCDPKDPRIHYNLGALSSHAGDHELAIPHYTKVAEMSPDAPDGYLGLASSYYNLGDMANAVYYYSQAYNRAPHNAEVTRSFGATLLKLGQLAKARYYLEQAVEAMPDWAEPHIELGEVLRRLGEDKDAVRELLTGLRIRQKADGLVSLSLIHLKYGEPRRALTHLENAMKLEAGHAPARHALGLVFSAIKDWPGALKSFEAAFTADPENLEYVLDYAGALLEAGGDPDKAYRYAAAVRVKDPNTVRAFEIMGRALAKQGKKEQAIAEMEKARTLIEMKEVQDSSLVPLYEHLADAYEAAEDFMMARAMLERAFTLAPQRNDIEERRKKLEGKF
jgi:tetratricopeptide (TPR) repeat protein